MARSHADVHAPVPATAPRDASELSVRSYVGEYAAHAHGHAQILLGLDGRLELEIAGRPAYVDASCGVLIPPEADHAFMTRGGARVLVVDAPAGLALARFKRFAQTPGLRACSRQPDAAEQIVRAVQQQPATQARRGLDLAALTQALDASLHEDWPTARMAAFCALSSQHFHARLQAVTGLTPQQFLRQRRLDRALRYLRGGGSLARAAMQVGYRTGSALSYALRRDRPGEPAA